MRNAPIGIFDSGIGGLTVAKAITEVLPHESIIYIGDTARVPYGPRSKEVITKFALQMASFLLERGVKFLVIACNTISALSYEEVKDCAYPIPIMGVIKPTVRAAINSTKNKKIGVIGTLGTINSDSYQQLLKFYNSDAQIFSNACPLFVPIAEEGMGEHLSTNLIAQEYLKVFKDNNIDTLVLGCTHYPLLLEAIHQTMGNEVKLIDSAYPTAEMLKERLTQENLLRDNTNKPTYEFFVTDAPDRVYTVASRFFGESLEGRIQKISLSAED